MMNFRFNSIASYGQYHSFFMEFFDCLDCKFFEFLNIFQQASPFAISYSIHFLEVSAISSRNFNSFAMIYLTSECVEVLKTCKMGTVKSDPIPEVARLLELPVDQPSYVYSRCQKKQPTPFWLKIKHCNRRCNWMTTTWTGDMHTEGVYAMQETMVTGR